MFTGKPQIKPYALLVCLLRSVLAWGTVVRECLVTAWQAQLGGACSARVESWNCSPALQRFSFEKEWESLPFRNQWKWRPCSLIMAFLKSTRKMAKIEAVGRKEWKEQGDLRVTVWTGMHLWRGTVDGTMETNYTSEQHPKESSMLLSESFSCQVLVFSKVRWIYLLKKPQFQNRNLEYMWKGQNVLCLYHPFSDV